MPDSTSQRRFTGRQGDSLRLKPGEKPFSDNQATRDREKSGDRCRIGRAVWSITRSPPPYRFAQRWGLDDLVMTNVYVSYLENLRFEGRKASPTKARELLPPRLHQALVELEDHLAKIHGRDEHV